MTRLFAKLCPGTRIGTQVIGNRVLLQTLEMANRVRMSHAATSIHPSIHPTNVYWCNHLVFKWYWARQQELELLEWRLYFNRNLIPHQCSLHIGCSKRLCFFHVYSERSRAQTGEGQTEGEPEFQAVSISAKLHVGLRPTNREIMAWAEIKGRTLITDRATQVPPNAFVNQIVTLCPSSCPFLLGEYGFKKILFIWKW